MCAFAAAQRYLVLSTPPLPRVSMPPAALQPIALDD
eukprot:gene29910-8379_t